VKFLANSTLGFYGSEGASTPEDLLDRDLGLVPLVDELLDAAPMHEDPARKRKLHPPVDADTGSHAHDASVAHKCLRNRRKGGASFARMSIYSSQHRRTRSYGTAKTAASEVAVAARSSQ
jgi:hypothetical protein